jgi:hypothetical protein
LNPQFVGIKYFSQHYLAKENLFTDKLTQDQYFNTIQLWENTCNTKSSVFTEVSLIISTKKNNAGDIRISGIGDANVMGIYQILASKDSYHQLNGGIGIKIPLGKFDEKGITGVNPSFQLGTGSWIIRWRLVTNIKKACLHCLSIRIIPLKLKIKNIISLAISGIMR